MNLCTLEVGPIRDQAKSQYDSYPTMVREWLAPALPEATFSAVSVFMGESLPDVDDYDGYLVTGSRYGAYEELSWLEPFRGFIRSLRPRRKPIFGICFGHQIIAQSHGARVCKSQRGWAMGVQQYCFSDAYINLDGPYFVFHQDQVESVPERATVIGSSEQCPIGALAYDFPALSVQYHPEFVEQYVRLLIDLKEGQLPRDLTSRARESLREKVVNNDTTAWWAADFFRYSTVAGIRRTSCGDAGRTT